MCGIAGIVELGPDAQTRTPETRLLRALAAALAPRGPDGEGVFVAPGVGLAHRRLAVIDLTDAAAQPMTSDDGQSAVVFNGEIYNFQDLRAELTARGQRFRSRSDTEVILRGYEVWGDDVVTHLEGMFAFALWDGRRQRLLAARDRMGKKPFYFAHLAATANAPPRFAFASELKALRLLPGFDDTLSETALKQYLAFEYVPPPLTIHRGARKLDASERLRLDPSGAEPVTVDRYWDLPFPDAHARTDEGAAASELWSLLRRATERRLISDVPLGIFLSGGIDSTAVTAAAVDLLGSGKQVKTFSIGFSDPSYDESSQARLVARHLGTDHRERILDPRTLIDVLPKVTAFLDEPLADASIVPTYLVSRFAREHVTVALGGDGGDELFEGYPTFAIDLLGLAFFDVAPTLLRSIAERVVARLPAGTGYMSADFKARQFLRGAGATGPRRHQQWLSAFLPEEQGRLLRPAVDRAGGPDPLAPVDERVARGPARDRRDRLMDFYARFFMSGQVLVKVDRASSAVGLEVRAPLLDTDVVRFACLLPPDLRRRGRVSKRVLKAALQGRVPDEILRRKKQGFAMPVAAWLKGDLQGLLRETLSPANLRRDGLFDPGEVGRLIDDHVSGRRDRRKQLWTLLTFQRWLERWGPGRVTAA